MTNNVILYRAKEFITMDAAHETATHVAVLNGRIHSVGGEELEQRFGKPNLTFSDYTVTPGFVEGHAHAQEGTIWKMPYVGYFDRRHPDGPIVEGCNTVQKLIARLKDLEQSLETEDQPLFAWGYDAIYFSSKPMRQDLDAVSTKRPVVVFHSNLHLITVNSVALELAGITRDNIIEGVYVDEHGEPNGELAEFAAMFPVFDVVGNPVFGEMNDAEGLRRFGQSCHNVGITTCADLYNDLEPDVVNTFEQITKEGSFQIRMVSVLGAMQLSISDAIDRVNQIKNRSHEKLHLGSIKIITDGSIQGYSARVRQPYVNGVQNGVWFEAPEKMKEMITSFHENDIKLHIHVNGDESAELVLQIFEELIPITGRKQRHVLQHAQMMDRDQLVRASGLGLIVNLFANHIFYWGDQHREMTVGPEIATRMNPARTALDVGLDIAIHCDAPVSPLGPLFTAWAAVNRQTASGKDLGPAECITAKEALHAITLGAATSLDLQHCIGSISPGKFADFTVLDDNPLTTNPEDIRHISVIGTMLDGNWQPAQ